MLKKPLPEFIWFPIEHPTLILKTHLPGSLKWFAIYVHDNILYNDYGLVSLFFVGRHFKCCDIFGQIIYLKIDKFCRSEDCDAEYDAYFYTFC